MSSTFSRPLEDNELASSFLIRVLGYRKCDGTSDLAVKVADAELLLSFMTKADTLTSSRHRNPSYCSDADRESLRERIFLELIQNKRPPEDDLVALGVGGVVPPDGIGVRRDREAFILIGLPASGKSTVSNKVADCYGAYIVDSDYAKRKFPEYKQSYGAALLHEESGIVTFGSDKEKYKDEKSVIGYCISEGVNIVIPKIGNRHETIRILRDFLIGYGYKVHLILIKADRLCATKRALERFEKTNRYVPIALIFDGYSNDPILSYYYMYRDCEWSSVGILSTENSPPVPVESIGDSPISLYRS